MKNILVLLLVVLCCQCNWFRKDDPKPKLPPATQEGKKTFGCYVNSYAWVPEGRPNFYTPNLEVYYNSSTSGGSFDLRAQRATDDHGGAIIITMFGLSGTGHYPLGIVQNQEVILRVLAPGCDYRSRDQDVTGTGTLTITRLDLQARVIAGTFEFTLAKPGCDTIRVTEGRFDMPL